MFGCFKHVGIPFDILDKMPTRDRKYYIAKHNEILDGEKSKHSKNDTVNGVMINKFTDMEQQKIKNLEH